MRYNLRTDNVDLTELDQEYLDKKLDRIVKYLKTPYVADIVFERNNHHRQGQVISCKINITQGKQVIHAERSEGSVQDALDKSIDAIKQSLLKLRDKEKAKRFSVKNLLPGK